MAPKRKTAAKASGGVQKKKAAKPATAAPPPAVAVSATDIAIEACKSCGVFKRRAAELEKLVKEEAPGASFVVNPDKPRRGTFEVRRGDKVFVSLQALPRPFTKLRELDMAALAAKVAADVQQG